MSFRVYALYSVSHVLLQMLEARQKKQQAAAMNIRPGLDRSELVVKANHPEKHVYPRPPKPQVQPQPDPSALSRSQHLVSSLRRPVVYQSERPAPAPAPVRMPYATAPTIYYQPQYLPPGVAPPHMSVVSREMIADPRQVTVLNPEVAAAMQPAIRHAYCPPDYVPTHAHRHIAHGGPVVAQVPRDQVMMAHYASATAPAFGQTSARHQRHASHPGHPAAAQMVSPPRLTLCHNAPQLMPLPVLREVPQQQQSKAHAPNQLGMLLLQPPRRWTHARTRTHTRTHTHTLSLPLSIIFAFIKLSFSFHCT